MTDLSSLHKKAQKAVASALEPSESILIAQPGEAAALVATNRRILIAKWGLTSGAMFGSQVNSWDFAHVTGVEFRKGMTTTAIVVQSAGAQAVTDFGRMDTGPTSVWQAPNALFVSDGAGEATVATLRQMVADHQRPGPSASAGAAPGGQSSDSDAIGQIREYAALRDEGLITEEEFQVKKKSLLGI